MCEYCIPYANLPSVLSTLWRCVAWVYSVIHRHNSKEQTEILTLVCGIGMNVYVMSSLILLFLICNYMSLYTFIAHYTVSISRISHTQTLLPLLSASSHLFLYLLKTIKLFLASHSAPLHAASLVGHSLRFSLSLSLSPCLSWPDWGPGVSLLTDYENVMLLQLLLLPSLLFVCYEKHLTVFIHKFWQKPLSAAAEQQSSSLYAVCSLQFACSCLRLMTFCN